MRGLLLIGWTALICMYLWSASWVWGSFNYNTRIPPEALIIFGVNGAFLWASAGYWFANAEFYRAVDAVRKGKPYDR